MFFCKQESYQQLVAKRKVCSMCQGLSNPHTLNPSFDVPEIGAWSAWQGSLNAKIMVVGQDWADTLAYLKDGSTDSIKNPTNKNLVKLLKSIGVNAEAPESGIKNPDLFFTNAILCLKEGEKRMQEDTLEEWYRTCGQHFLRPLIELVQPEAVIALGLMATNGILHAYNLTTYGVLRKAVEIEEGIRLGGKTTLFPIYHCGNRGVNQNRKMEEQLRDWRKIGRYLGSGISVPVPVAANRKLSDY